MATKGVQRDWCFTLNNYNDADLYSLGIIANDAKYLICGFEKGKEGTQHVQGYVYFDKKISLKQLKEYNDRAHFERRMAPKIADAVNYCKKDGEYVEFGKEPAHGGEKVTYEMIENAMKSPEEHPILYMRYKKGYDLMQQEKVFRQKVNTKYFCIDNTGDFITEIITYFDWTEDDCKSLAVVTDLADIEAYKDKVVTRVIYIPEIHELKHDLWPRGVPISYKFGYEIRVIRPETLVIVTNQPKYYKLYKYIKY